MFTEWQGSLVTKHQISINTLSGEYILWKRIDSDKIVGIGQSAAASLLYIF